MVAKGQCTSGRPPQGLKDTATTAKAITKQNGGANNDKGGTGTPSTSFSHMDTCGARYQYDAFPYLLFILL